MVCFVYLHTIIIAAQNEHSAYAIFSVIIYVRNTISKSGKRCGEYGCDLFALIKNFGWQCCAFSMYLCVCVGVYARALKKINQFPEQAIALRVCVCVFFYAVQPNQNYTISVGTMVCTTNCYYSIEPHSDCAK